MYHRLGHIEPSVTLGQKVKAGQQVGTNGTGNGQWLAHCHYDIIREKPSSWNTFVIGWSRVSVEKAYKDPRPYRDIVMPTFHHYGYEWLEDAQYTGGHAYHPGIDLNGPGAGNDDLGLPICSPVDGLVVHVHKGTDGNGGWGDMVIIKEVKEEDMEKEFVDAVESLTGKEYGDKLNENEQKDAAKRIVKHIDDEAGRLLEDIERIEELKKEIEELSKRPESCPECASTEPVEVRVPAEDMTWSEHLGWAIHKLLPKK